MTGINKDLFVSSDRYGNLMASDPGSWARANCAFCDGDQMVVVASTGAYPSNDRPAVQWLRCIHCLHGVVTNYEIVSPSTQPLDTPKVLKGDDLATWTEVRACLSVGANTAAVMMCRKLLLHVAVAHGLPEKNAKGWAPNFFEALDYMEAQGIFTKHMRPWIERIKDVGNEANHELTSIHSDDALDVARFTRQLLNLAYELPSMIGDI